MVDQPHYPLQSERFPAPLSVCVGERHDANVVFRAQMEDNSCIHSFKHLPALFLAIYDGHGGAKVSALLHKQLHRLFMDELLLNCVENVDSDTNSDSSLPHDDDHELATDPVNFKNSRQATSSDVSNAFKQSYQKMDAMLRKHRCMRVGSTAVTCFLRVVSGVGRVLTVANCGDCRAVLSRAGKPLRLTQDHRPCDALERVRVEEAGGFVTCKRVNGILNVSRAFGDHSMKSCIVSTPYLNEIVLGVMDEFLVLACDGLWDFVDEQTVITLAQEAFDRGMNSDEVAGVLVKAAIDHNSTDNVSVMVVQLDVDGAE